MAFLGTPQMHNQYPQVIKKRPSHIHSGIPMAGRGKGGSEHRAGQCQCHEQKAKRPSSAQDQSREEQKPPETKPPIRYVAETTFPTKREHSSPHIWRRASAGIMAQVVEHYLASVSSQTPVLLNKEKDTGCVCTQGFQTKRRPTHKAHLL
jgi:hypothetical protein